MGGAVLARSSFPSGMLRWQAGRLLALFLAWGFVLIGQGESVVALRVTTSSRQRSLSEESRVLSPKTRISLASSGPDLYKFLSRRTRLALANISGPASR